METWHSEHEYDLCAFLSRNDLVMTGRATSTSGDNFTIGDSKYADDTGLAFERPEQEDHVSETAP